MAEASGAPVWSHPGYGALFSAIGARIAVAYAGEERLYSPSLTFAWAEIGEGEDRFFMPVAWGGLAPPGEPPFVVRPEEAQPPLLAPSKLFSTYDEAVSFVEAAPGFKRWLWVSWMKPAPAAAGPSA